MDSPEEEERQRAIAAKAALFGANAFLLVVILTQMRLREASWTTTVLVAIIILALNVVTSALAVRFAEVLSAWGFPDSHRAWSESTRLFCGTIWPGTLVFWLIIAPFNRVVRTLYT